MTSKNRVKKAILFQGPDRIPFDFPKPWSSDFLWVNTDPNPLFNPKLSTKTKWEDEWGSVWEKLPNDKTMGQIKTQPLHLYENIKYYKFPDYKKPSRYLSAKNTILKNKDEKFIMAETFTKYGKEFYL